MATVTNLYSAFVPQPDGNLALIAKVVLNYNFLILMSLLLSRNQDLEESIKAGKILISSGKFKRFTRFSDIIHITVCPRY